MQFEWKGWLLLSFSSKRLGPIFLVGTLDSSVACLRLFHRSRGVEGGHGGHHRSGSGHLLGSRRLLLLGSAKHGRIAHQGGQIKAALLGLLLLLLYSAQQLLRHELLQELRAEACRGCCHVGLLLFWLLLLGGDLRLLLLSGLRLQRK